MSKQDDELSKYAIRAWVSDGDGKQHTEMVVQLKIAQRILADSFTKAEVLRALEPLRRKPTHGTCCTCQTCGYPNDNECKCDENDLKLRIAEALGLTSKETEE